MDLSVLAGALTSMGMALGVSADKLPAAIGAVLVVLAALLNLYRARQKANKP